ncbi:outer membrane beta-barrel family protein [Chryseosolibacter indicus]|uniref:TonB-dependent receptor n=1 Tax=Chryseosolibacter indicus TaxID=2782351 RepID=A0ABS5VNK9_9BACT|nr:outer membrane beta-barrel family protein [Chryseosolibacter indicus]MBT1702608.1 TonB-dependent receptor [Chryseosolibacter indicus]
MKNIYYLSLVVLSLCCSLPALAQKGNAEIKGTVVDSVTQKPVEFANVALTKADNNTPIDGAVCDEKGGFTLRKVAEGNYNLLISFIGFDTRTVNVTVDDRKDINLGTIIISPTPRVLKEVTVEGQKALIEEKVDRTIYNAENDATAKGGDATDVLKRVPMLSVDMDGNVSLRGNQNIQVLINNKPSTIVASSIADALKQIPADQIKTVEVITSPSAKYDAEGSAGIINIVTKKNNLEGLTLNLDAGVGLRGSNLGLNGNYRRKKMGFSLGGWGRANYNVTGEFENEQTTYQMIDGVRTEVSNSIQSADTRNRGLFGNYTFGWDYDINEKNFITSSVRFGVRNNKRKQFDLFTGTYDIDDVLQRYSLSGVQNLDNSNTVDASLTFTHLYEKPQHELSFQGQFSRNNQTSDFINDVFESTVPTLDFKNVNDSYNQEATLQVDYQMPIGTNQMLELGGKDIMRKVYSDFSSFENQDGIYVPRTGMGVSLNNNLNYDQNVMAGYLSYTITTKQGYSFKAGSRYEYTTIDAYTRTEDNIKIPSYGVFVPSVNASKKLKNGNTIKASYNRRIQRPSIRFLNPNAQFQNNLNVTVGNPTLQPEYTNNYEIGYSTFVKGVSLSFTGFVRNTNDAIQSIRDVINKVAEDQDTIRTTYQNIGLENAYGGSVFANIMLGKLTLNGGGDVFYTVLDNNSPLPEYKAKNEGWVVSGRLFGSYNLDKGWAIQFFGFGRGRQVQLQGTQGSFRMYSVGFRKEFNEKRGSIGLAAENFLTPSMKINSETKSLLIDQRSVNTLNNLSFRVNFSYRIGKMGLDNSSRRRKRSINNDDLKDGGGDNMQMGGEGGTGGGQQPRGQGQAPSFGGARNQQPAQRPQTQPADAAQQQDSVKYEPTGTWDFTIDSPQGGSGTIVLKKENDTYTGTIKTNRMPQETVLTNVTVNGNQVSFSYPVNFGGNTSTVTVSYTISKDDIQGTMDIAQFRSFNLTGKRTQ